MTWKSVKIGFLVTGKSELGVDKFFRQLATTGGCHFPAHRWIKQYRLKKEAPTKPIKPLTPIDSKKKVPDKYFSDIGVPARQLNCDFVVLIDDLEHDWRDRQSDVYGLYRDALNSAFPKSPSKASVHFFVNMLESYYFADHETTNAVLGTALSEHPDDVEDIRHPKNLLKGLVPQHNSGRTFDEVQDGQAIMANIRLETVLQKPQHCRSLRTLVKWLVTAAQTTPPELESPLNGELHPVTKDQIGSLEAYLPTLNRDAGIH